MTKIIGRNAQLGTLKEILDHSNSSMIAVTGRRRVGKTFLIDQSLKSHMKFRMTGIQNGSMNEQLVNFNEKLKEFSGAPFLSTPSNWQEAFTILKRFLESLPASNKKVIFFDEVPWIHTARSGFLEKLAHLWNDYFSKEENYIVVLCGSATSWINKNVIMAKGGLHNRITHVLKVDPFTLSETRLFLNSKGIRLSDQDLSRIYMAMGGVPYYLEHIKKGESATVAIERICFEPIGLLRNEYNYLYKALFTNANDHESIVKVLAKSQGGISREEIIKRSGVQSGGPYNRA
ncbi:MAG: AAA family ATPase, partial [Saprospiraceae bacterium]|nr:AAA family ATPase [Saprospiraceae bacterium]